YIGGREQPVPEAERLESSVDGLILVAFAGEMVGHKGAGHLVGSNGLRGQKARVIGCCSSGVRGIADYEGDAGLPGAVLESEERRVRVIDVAGELEDRSR